MMHSGVLYISEQRWAPKCRGARSRLTYSPYRTLSTGLVARLLYLGGWM